MTTNDTITAPWTPEQVDALNRYQQFGMFHPFTCGNDHAGNDVLRATLVGWVCPTCDYKQNWAYATMADTEWVNVYEQVQQVCQEVGGLIIP